MFWEQNHHWWRVVDMWSILRSMPWGDDLIQAIVCHLYALTLPCYSPTTQLFSCLLPSLSLINSVICQVMFTSYVYKPCWFYGSADSEWFSEWFCIIIEGVFLPEFKKKHSPCNDRIIETNRRESECTVHCLTVKLLLWKTRQTSDPFL